MGLHLNDLLQRATGLCMQEAVEYQRARELELLVLPFISGGGRTTTTEAAKENRSDACTGGQDPLPEDAAVRTSRAAMLEPADDQVVARPEKRPGHYISSHRVKRILLKEQQRLGAAGTSRPASSMDLVPGQQLADSVVSGKRRESVPAARRPLLELPPQLLLQQQQRLMKQQQQRMLLQQALMPGLVTAQQPQLWSMLPDPQQLEPQMPASLPQPPVVLQPAPALTVQLPPELNTPPPAAAGGDAGDGMVPTLSPAMPARTAQRTIPPARATRRQQLRLSLPSDSPPPLSPSAGPRAISFTALDTSTTPGKLFNRSPSSVVPPQGIPVLSSQQLADVAAQCYSNPQDLCMSFSGASPAAAAMAAPAAAAAAGGNATGGLPPRGLVAPHGVFGVFGSPLEGLAGMPLASALMGVGNMRPTSTSSGMAASGPPLFTEVPLVMAAGDGGAVSRAPPVSCSMAMMLPPSSTAATINRSQPLALQPLVLPSLDGDVAWDSIPSVTWRALDLAAGDTGLSAALSALTPTVTGSVAASEAAGGGAAGQCGWLKDQAAAGQAPANTSWPMGPALHTTVRQAADLPAASAAVQAGQQARSVTPPALELMAGEEGQQRVSLGGDNSCQTQMYAAPCSADAVAQVQMHPTASYVEMQRPSMSSPQDHAAAGMPTSAPGTSGLPCGSSSSTIRVAAGGGVSGMVRLTGAPGAMGKGGSLGGGRHRLTAQGWVSTSEATPGAGTTGAPKAAEQVRGPLPRGSGGAGVAVAAGGYASSTSTTGFQPGGIGVYTAEGVLLERAVNAAQAAAPARQTKQWL